MIASFSGFASRNRGREFCALLPRKKSCHSENADVVAIADVELFHLLAVQSMLVPHTRPSFPVWFQALKIVRKRDPRMRTPRSGDDHSRSLHIHILPADRIAPGGADAQVPQAHRTKVTGSICQSSRRRRRRCRSQAASGLSGFRNSKISRAGQDSKGDSAEPLFKSSITSGLSMSFT